MVSRPVPGEISAFSESLDISRGGGPRPPLYGARWHRSFWRGGATQNGSCFQLQPFSCPDLGTVFHKNAFQHIFPENAPQIGLSISGSNSPLSYKSNDPKNQQWEQAAIIPGVQGRSPGPLSPHFSGEMGTPAGQAGQRGVAPQGREEPRPPQGYAVPSFLHQGLENHPALWYDGNNSVVTMERRALPCWAL